MRMKNLILSNFSKFIAMLKQHMCSYPHWKKDEFDRVNGLERAKDICDPLQRAQ
jgi:hypothetical protein